MKTLLSAFLLATAAFSQAAEIHVTFTSSLDLFDTLFAYKSTAPGLDDQNGHPLGDLTAGSHAADIIVEGDTSQYDFYRYSLLANYSGLDGVVVGLEPASALAAIGTSFESTFGTSETSIHNAIQGIYSGDYATLLASIKTLSAFEDANLDKFPIGRADGLLLAFSDGMTVGTISAAPVPEPASLAALGLGVVMALQRRKRTSL